MKTLNLMITANTVILVFTLFLGAFYLLHQPFAEGTRTHEAVADQIRKTDDVEAVRELAIVSDYAGRKNRQFVRAEFQIYRVAFPVIACVCLFNAIVMMKMRKKGANNAMEAIGDQRSPQPHG